MTCPQHTLLLIEDFAPDRELYRRYLHVGSGELYSVLEAENASVGLELCRSQKIDAILLDYSLPDDDGLTFLKALDAQSLSPKPAVVMISGVGSESIAVQAMKLGAENYLVKNQITPELLQITLKSAIENTRLRLQLQESQAQLSQEADRIRREEADRRYAEQQLRDSQERLQIGIQVAGVALARFDYRTSLVELSEEAAELYGIAPEELIGGKWVSRDRIHDSFHPDEREQMEAIIRNVVDPSGTGWFSGEHRIVTYTGKVRWLFVRKQVFFDRTIAPPCPDYAILAAIDVTHRKHIEAERERLLAEAEAARAEAEAANRSKDEFVAMVAHELRSPLNSIAGWAKILQMRRHDEATMDKALDTIVRNTDVQVQLVEDLLDIARIVRGNLRITRESVDFSAIVEAALTVVRPLADAKHIQLREAHAYPMQVYGDFNRLQQVVTNLLTNAIKFTPENGCIDVELRSEVDYLCLQIRDNGKGIAADFLPHIFDRYRQGQNSAGSKDGLGLGLAIVKHLVELHEGTIAADSAGKGQGATFTVRIPLLEAAPVSSAIELPSSNNSLTNLKILIVDDEPDQVDLLVFIFEEAGAIVKCASHLQDAIEVFSQFQPDILISDIAMPGGTGYDLLQQIRTLPNGNIPAIALTAYASTTDQEQSYQAGFQRHFSKPIEIEIVIQAIASLSRSAV